MFWMLCWESPRPALLFAWKGNTITVGFWLALALQTQMAAAAIWQRMPSQAIIA